MAASMTIAVAAPRWPRRRASTRRTSGANTMAKNPAISTHTTTRRAAVSARTRLRNEATMSTAATIERQGTSDHDE